MDSENRSDKKGCRICNKPTNQIRRRSPLKEVCDNCWESVFGVIGGTKKEKWKELLESLELELSKSEYALSKLAAEKRLPDVTSSRVTELAKKTSEMQLAQAFESFRIEALYHLTPIENIPSIFQHGLLSFNNAVKSGLDIETCSNPDIQYLRDSIIVGGRSGNDYVPLFFSEKNGTTAAMEYNERNLGRVIVYICVKKEIIGAEGVWFSDGNIASGRKTRAYHSIEDLKKLDWRTIREKYELVRDDEDKKRIKAAEVLVPFPILPSWFQKIIVPDSEARSSMEKLLPYPMNIEIKPEFYFTSRGKKK